MTLKNTLTEGTMLKHYRIDSVLGQGGFGITYLAFDTQLQRQVAIKECFPRDFVSRSGTTIVPTSAREKKDFGWALGKFVDEATTLARFRHPGIVQVLQILKEENNSAYIVLEYVDGQSLEAWLKKLGRQPTEPEIKRVLAPMIDALQVVHDNGVVHRDIAPDNIYIRKEGQAVLLDFGAAKQTLAQHSRTMNLIVKDGYSAPEQYYAEGRQGAWTDIYAFAAVIYRAMTGTRPVDAMARLDAFNNDEPDPIIPIRQAVPANLYSETFVNAVELGLTPQVKARPQSLAAWRISLFGAEPATDNVAPVDLETPPPTRLAPSSKARPSKKSSQDYKPKRGLVYGFSAAVGMAALAGFAYFATQTVTERNLQNQWQETLSTDTRQAYQRFVESHSQGPEATQARAILADFDRPWSRTFGAQGAEQANAVVASGETIFIGGAVVTSGADGIEAMVTAISLAGREKWRTTFGGQGNQIVHSLMTLNNGDVAVAGVTSKGSMDKEHGFIALLDADGKQKWLTEFTEVPQSSLYGITSSGGEGVIAAGYRSDGPNGKNDGWVVSVDAQGKKQWDRAMGGPEDDKIAAIRRVSGGQLAMAGEKNNNFWILSQAENGTTLVDRAAGGSKSDLLSAVDVMADGTILAVGETESFGSGTVDGMILRLMPDGKMPPKVLAEPRDDHLTAIHINADATVLVAGYTSSRGAGQTDGWLRKYDNQLNTVMWERVIGGAGWDEVRALAVLDDKSIIMVGSTDDTEAGDADVWVLRIGADGQFTDG
ncbi:MAG: serine/threonine-protein kinase [Ahrensia sp.]